MYQIDVVMHGKGPKKLDEGRTGPTKDQVYFPIRFLAKFLERAGSVAKRPVDRDQLQAKM
jgi:hypothetical protein